MKKIIFACLFSVIIILTAACNNSVENQPELMNLSIQKDSNYEDFKQALIDMEQDIVKSRIDSIISDIILAGPATSISKNERMFYALVNRLDDISNDISAESHCYACTKTKPPQSEILISIRSSGVEVKRIIDIISPMNDPMSCTGIHEF